ncbi:hypothetical protein [Gloeothece verrucosa]|nr:hypothetical protein [Gloeothece verrucosa]
MLASVIFLSGCNGGDKTTTDNNSPAPTTATSPDTGTASPATSTSEGTVDPITAGMTGAERQNTDPLELLQSDQLKTELKITPDQETKIKQITQDFRGKLQQIYGNVNLNGLPPAEQSKKLEEVSGPVQEEINKTRQEIGKVLSPNQVKRFKEITLQIYGFGVLNSDQYAQDLKLTDEQQKKIGTIRTQMISKMRTSWQIPPSDKQEKEKVIDTNRKVMEGIIKESNDEVLAVLTPDQKKSLESLKGEKFDFKPPAPPAS